MNFYDVLAAEKWGGGIPTINFFDLLFAQSISGEQWQVYEGTLPATLNANGSDLRQYQIYGATGGVGDVTETGEPTGYKIPISTEKSIIYGFHINPNDPNSYTAVTYLEDAVGKTPAAMGSTAFSYGDWADAFFMPRPCMLKYDGTVDYYLNPNDYSQKADGTPSDYNNLAYGGNAMMEFPLIWYKFVQGAENGEGYFYCSNRKVDDSYKCFSNMDCDGNIIDHFYMPIYNGCAYDGKMRSISGLQLSPWSTTAYSASATYAVGNKVSYNGRMWKCIIAIETAEAFDPEKWEQFAFNGNTTGTEEIAQVTANNTTAKTEWYIDQWCDRVLINGLLVLISKSIDTQGAFGRGIDTGSQAMKESYITGSLNDKGLFYGSTANGTTAVKVFGMENWWGLVWHRTAGLIGGANNTYLYKLTASTADGSTASAYNTNGSGYLSTNSKPTSNNYVKQMKFGAWGWLPFEVGAYSTQYYKDYYYNGTGFALVGGSSYGGAACGAFCVYLIAAVSYRAWVFGAAPSCKPCRVGNLSKNLESATITPIYIGDDPLDKDEYIDYQAGKIYRRTENQYDILTQFYGEGLNNNGNITKPSSISSRSGFISVTQNTPYTKKSNISDGRSRLTQFFDENKTFITQIPSSQNPTTFTTPNNCAFVRLAYPIDSTQVMLVEGSDAPEQFIPYFQPTDPPVPLPEIPTCEGTTVIDYAGQSVAPEKVYFEYQGGKQP